jgi:hypothetical protein
MEEMEENGQLQVMAALPSGKRVWTLWRREHVFGEEHKLECTSICNFL